MDAGRSWAVLGGPASTSLFYAPTVQNDEGVSDSVCAVRRFVYWRGGEAQTFNNLFVKNLANWDSTKPYRIRSRLTPWSTEVRHGGPGGPKA